MGYTPFGSWVDGSSPGVSAEFLNPLEAFLVLINSLATDANVSSDGAGNETVKALKTTHSISVNGTTAGTAKLLMPFQGSDFKAFMLKFSGYQNNTTTEQKIALPVSFTRALFLSGNAPQMTIWSGGSQVTGQTADVTALSSSGGTSGGFSAVHPLDFGEISAAFDTVGLGVSQASAFTSTIFVVGW